MLAADGTGVFSSQERHCNNLNVMLCLYHLLQIAHLFMQLLEHSNFIESMGHLTILATLLPESIRNMGVPDEIFSDDAPKMQIRFAKQPRKQTSSGNSSALPVMMLVSNTFDPAIKRNRRLQNIKN